MRSASWAKRELLSVCPIYYHIGFDILYSWPIFLRLFRVGKVPLKFPKQQSFPYNYGRLLHWYFYSLWWHLRIVAPKCDQGWISVETKDYTLQLGTDLISIRWHCTRTLARETRGIWQSAWPRWRFQNVSWVNWPCCILGWADSPNGLWCCRKMAVWVSGESKKVLYSTSTSHQLLHQYHWHLDTKSPRHLATHECMQKP